MNGYMKKYLHLASILGVRSSFEAFIELVKPAICPILYKVAMYTLFRIFWVVLLVLLFHLDHKTMIFGIQA
jgi:hypothetical protein